ncbi:serine hydrolase [Thermomonospora umbrina]|uniref:Beta-lactamase class A n=1 Tax=Thermomonospora umbrina TaxID=111806 RepID=A0A3D9SSG8_9ACTN|nr:serine hydrolase [Thermomonospora umbrina]REE98738.1 beta-lactamase class A [Thermomonospora umbrina]
MSSRRSLPALAVVLALVLSLVGPAASRSPGRPVEVAAAPTGTVPTPQVSSAPEPPPPEPRELASGRLTRAIDRYLKGRPLSLSVRDLATGIAYRYRPGARFVTASVAKVDIVMTLLLQAQKQGRRLDAYERRLAEQAIRYSDNKATDRLWERVGGAGPVAAANRRFGLKKTKTVDGRCLDLYCWGITDTTADEQIRLLSELVDDKGPLDARNRAYVLKLMGTVAPEQAWGVSAAARDGDRVALKNGWQRRLSHGKLWAINSVGRVRTGGHDLLIAVLSDHHATSAAGIAVVERVVGLAAGEFRRTTPWVN